MIHRITYLITLPVLLACCTLSCTAEDPAGGTLPVKNSLNVSSAIMSAGNPATRLAGDNAPVAVTQGSLGIFRSQGPDYADEQNNKQYTYIGTDKGWQAASSDDVIHLSVGNVEVCAYYPYHSDASYSDKTALPLVSSEYTATSGTHDPADICYDIDRTMNGSRSSTSFTMKHALAMLEFKLSKEACYTGECRVTSVTIQNPDLIISSAIDITGGTYSGTTVKGALTYYPGTDAGGILIGSDAVTTAALLVPFTPTAAGLTVSFSVNGIPVETNIPAATIANVEAGHRYTVKITLKGASMQVTGVDMMPWADTQVGGDGTVWYPEPWNPARSIGIRLSKSDIDLGGTECTEQDKADLSLLRWAPGHLRQTNDDGTGAVIFAGPTEYGHYYTYKSEYTGSTISNGIDPCTVLDIATYGSGWRTPTNSELDKLGRCCDKQLVSNNGVTGMWFMNNTKGLFMPAAGGRDIGQGSGTEATQSSGSGAYVWSASHTGSSAFFFMFYTNRASTTFANETSGASVRCVWGAVQNDPQ